MRKLPKPPHDDKINSRVCRLGRAIYHFLMGGFPSAAGAGVTGNKKPAAKNGGLNCAAGGASAD